ncbi:hypothetical protein FVEG_00211 [Fusarium verticillioides 7600]|uniref:Uncharacterized protein n=1 Tax=Gibberella moniliformis (strain M3125 / FGSC 7600) TaxID=334819 RepID=W7LKS3_GIBM7|nr:hypothetical protein FVEG_00211 [Fusarium verticillioides 7600]EWG36044.1 hypothetical protein FVEG_00211 [Fusarium verticillioides 7600]
MYARHLELQARVRYIRMRSASASSRELSGSSPLSSIGSDLLSCRLR